MITKKNPKSPFGLSQCKLIEMVEINPKRENFIDRGEKMNICDLQTALKLAIPTNPVETRQKIFKKVCKRHFYEIVETGRF